MANSNAPYGFRFLRLAGGSAPTDGQNTYPIAYNYATAIGKGDVVTLNSSGQVILATPGTTTILGVFNGCSYYDPTINQTPQFRPNWPGSSLSSANFVVQAYIVDYPDAVFEVQSDAANIALTDVGANIQFVAGTVGISGYSTQAVGQSTINPATTTLPFRIVALGRGIKNDNTSSFNSVEVVFNNVLANSRTGV